MIANEGKTILSGAAVISVMFLLLAVLYDPLVLAVLAGLSIFFLFFSLWFFRDPVRDVKAAENQIISPADGKIVKIEKVDDPAVGKSATQISIFLSVFNVHVNRMPVNGVFESMEYRKGKFLAAYDHQASDINEQTDIVIKNDSVKIRIKQIAGLLARRILCYAVVGEKMTKGSRLGFIRFGSRTDIILPAGVEPKVAMNQKVVGNKNIIGEY